MLKQVGSAWSRLLAAAIVGCAGASALAQCTNPTSGPDVIVSSVSGASNYGSVGSITAFAVGTTSCNVGDANLDWEDSDPRHPVIAQNLFRLKDGRIEQIGMAWLKHGFASTNSESCGCNCDDPGTFRLLGPGCSDTYDSTLNGEQFTMGPRSEVNAFTGEFPYPPSNQGNGNAIYKRLQAEVADIDPALNPGALYYAETQYVALDDAMFGNQANNTSYRPVTFSFSGGRWRLSTTGSTVQQKAAIQAWRTADPTVTETEVLIPDEGRLIVSAKATDLGDGTHRYEYAVYNQYSDRSVGAFTVPLPASATVSNIGFHDVAYHSGEPYSGTDWVGTRVGDTIVWATETHAANPNANAIRWGTTYNFRFDADVAPTTGDATLGLFKPGTPESVTASTIVPTISTPALPGDLNGDCVVDLTDLGTMLANFGLSGQSYEDGDIDGNGTIDLGDLGVLLSNYGQTC